MESHDRLIYIAHPVSGDVQMNLVHGRLWLRWAYDMNAGSPIAPWMSGCEVLNENLPEHRELGMRCDLVALRRCDELWLCGDRISTGMRAEADVAKAEGLLVRDFTFAQSKLPPAGKWQSLIWKTYQ